MFGGSGKSSSFMGGGSSSGGGGESMIPGFQDESACSSLCPDLTYTQRYANFTDLVQFC
jgi:hypothetical protein